MHKLIALSIGLFTLGLQSHLQAQHTVLSPNQNIKVSVELKGGLSYSVHAFGHDVLQSSKMRLELANSVSIGQQPQLEKTTRRVFDEVWSPVLKENDKIRDHGHELVLHLVEATPEPFQYQVIFRAYDDGIAFRYVFPEQSGREVFEVHDEMTHFHFANDAQGWIANFEKYTSSQEKAYLKQSISSIEPRSYTGLPLLVEISPDCWAAITEAALVDHAGMYLEAAQSNTNPKSNGVALKSLLAGKPSGAKVKAALPHLSPWRVMLLGQQPGQLIESELIMNLNEPNRLKDSSWIQSGMSAWDHWWTANVKMDTATIKTYIDFAANMGWPFQLIDWQWYGSYKKPDSDLRTVNASVNMDEVRAHAKSKGVRLWLWMHHLDLKRQDMDEVFSLYRSWGIAGVKIDFMDSDDQATVNWYHKVLETAAKHELLVNFHGSYKPTGLRRTYPNLMTREGVFGNEHNRSGNKVSPLHNLTLPFTRGLAGPMDVTPGGFINRHPEQFKALKAQPTQVMGTRSHELAKFVVYFSPVTTMADHPDRVVDQAGSTFLMNLPTLWDETRVLSGYPGEHIVVARRHQQDWFLGGMTVAPREHSVHLSFLGEGEHLLERWSDSKASHDDATQLLYQRDTVTCNTELKLNTVRNGGFVLRISPKRHQGRSPSKN